MSPSEAFTKSDLDILKEVLNIGVGKGVSVVSEMIDNRIELISPIIEFSTDFIDITSSIKKCCGSGSIGVLQEFVGDLTGATIMAFSKESASALVRLLLQYDDNKEILESEYPALEEIANCLINGTIGTLANYIDIDLNYQLPHFFSEMNLEKNKLPYTLNSKNKQEGILILKSGLKISEKNIYLTLMIIIGISSLEKIISLTKTKYLHEK